MRTSVTILALCKLRNTFHKNREISILTIKKKTARLTFLRKPQKEPNKGRQKRNKNQGHNYENLR